jgi:hypothetical protein
MDYRLVAKPAKRNMTMPVFAIQKRMKMRIDYQKTERGKAAHKRAVNKWLDKNDIKRKSHIIVGNAIKYGKLKKEPCEVCGCLDVHAHHDDYAKPLDIRWLCDIHHNEWHSKYGEAANSERYNDNAA